MHTTENALKDNVKKKVIGMLNARLADAIDLALLTKQAHWTLRGPRFIAVHEMLDEFRDQLDEWVDTLAERISQLGGTPLGTLQAVGAGTSLQAYPTDLTDITAHLKALAERYAAVTNATRKCIDEADEAGDAVTADIFTDVARDLDKDLWFIEAHFES